MKKLFKQFLKITLIVLFLAALWKYELVIYGVRQFKGQMTILFNSVPVEDVLKDPKLKTEFRDKLLLTGEIRKYAMDSLGLKNSKNYTFYYDQHDQPIMWVVTGCLPYELKAKEWWFPFLGEVSYKGFFIEKLALEEEQLIRSEGYETDIYSPSAWSTLGYFKDPIFSNMLKRGPGRLSELIIHELTHATIYLQSNVEFNENLATFIGEKGAERFLLVKYGEGSDEYKKYMGYLADELIYSEYMMLSATRLDSLYKTFTVQMPVKEKAIKKYNMIAGIMSGIKQLPLFYPERYRFDFKNTRLPNNTEFMAFLRYRKKQDNFTRVFKEKYNSDLKVCIADIVIREKNNEPLPFK